MTVERVGWLFIFSLTLWLSALLGLWNDVAALVLLMAGFVIGFPGGFMRNTGHGAKKETTSA